MKLLDLTFLKLTLLLVSFMKRKQIETQKYEVFENCRNL